MASPNIPPRTIVPLAGAKKTRPTRIVPGSLHLFTHPAQRITAPVRAHFARRYNRPGSFGAALFLFDALAAALVLALAVTLGSFVLAPGAVAPVRLSVTASDAEVRAADTVGFVVHYENRGKLPLENASLAISLPDGFRTTSLEAERATDAAVEPLTAHGVIPLGTVGPGGNGTVRVSGYVLVGHDTDAVLEATLTGTPSGRPPVQEKGSSQIRIAGTALRLGVPEIADAHIAAPGSVRPVLFTNDSANAIDSLHLVIAHGNEQRVFVDREFSAGAQESIVLEELAAEEDWLISISDAKRPVSILQELGMSAATAWNELRISRFEPGLGDHGLEVVVGVASGDHRIDWGSLRVFPEPWDMVDPTALPGGSRIEGVPADARFTLEPNDSYETVVRVPLRPEADPKLMTVRAIAYGAGTGERVGFVSTERVGIQAAAPTLAAELRYYTEEGEQLGRGPLPPRVDEKTEYWVVVRAEPGLIMQDTELRVDLGGNVTYAGKFSASVSGVPRQVGNALVWRPDVIAGDGAFTFAAALAFRPTTDQIDAEAVIVRSVRLSGQDAEGAPTEATTGYLATDVPADTRAAEKGTRVSGALE
ncbi:hypothetical protein EPO33_02815 [Patescibacteria group bacterium]|nr:MAG: hypothetical protein EPO33_02815 [Patescibacteria group bacterium]